MIEITWDCTICGASNTDDFAESISPICGVCGMEYFDWVDIITDEQYAEANTKLAAASGRSTR